MIPGTNHSARQMFLGNILLVGCCVFYLLWWVLAFKPAGAVKGMKSGWLLIPAFLLGIGAVVMIIKGANSADTARSFFSARGILLAAVISYVVLLLVTIAAFHRQVTTELLLIVGWTALVFFESNALYGMGITGRSSTICLFVIAIIAAVISMICYVLYYGLGDRAGYIDGMIPLILAAVYMAVLSVFIARAGS